MAEQPTTGVDKETLRQRAKAAALARAKPDRRTRLSDNKDQGVGNASSFRTKSNMLCFTGKEANGW